MAFDENTVRISVLATRILLFVIAAIIIYVSARIRIVLKSAAGCQYHDHCGFDEWIAFSRFNEFTGVWGILAAGLSILALNTIPDAPAISDGLLMVFYLTGAIAVTVLPIGVPAQIFCEEWKIDSQPPYTHRVERSCTIKPLIQAERTLLWIACILSAFALTERLITHRSRAIASLDKESKDSEEREELLDLTSE
ncbi:uncharacterized protein K489DRAFT_407471 [Dissoconium aciculare CBS 342.82]|uniref:Uncharacterized protein n=1 Tax=Dissoconium aciculare CBS 342.82 TaxID=1314786 RepID=A0A6J3MFM4_9PEZI|nr:uncharacterized protein K489DRAFT_407471 [Dissoconium aciculare CBS 342.82]KAF1826775.1 hypothetical protein K489DRAFT_407471 [Dissoconium aciculare CBS 342.82]